MVKLVEVPPPQSDANGTKGGDVTNGVNGKNGLNGANGAGSNGANNSIKNNKNGQSGTIGEYKNGANNDSCFSEVHCFNFGRLNSNIVCYIPKSRFNNGSPLGIRKFLLFIKRVSIFIKNDDYNVRST